LIFLQKNLGNDLKKILLKNFLELSAHTPHKKFPHRNIFIPSSSISNKKCNKHFNCTEKKNQSKYLQAIDNRFCNIKIAKMIDDEMLGKKEIFSSYILKRSLVCNAAAMISYVNHERESVKGDDMKI
jgi:hypothetical protein